jgi:endonuclease III
MITKFKRSIQATFLPIEDSIKKQPDQKPIDLIAERLKSEYGHSASQPNVFNIGTKNVAGIESEPLDGLIVTILSQQSQIAITQRTADALLKAYPDWNDALIAGSDDIQQTLQAAKGNLTKTKADYIYGVLSYLKEERGELSLSFLRSYQLADARKLLLSFKGVGAKTASCVLLFNLQLPAMPVDTHVLRISKRLELVDKKANSMQVQTWFEENLPQKWEAHYEFHLNTIEHGRSTCKALNPQCERCILNAFCPSAEINLSN